VEAFTLVENKFLHNDLKPENVAIYESSGGKLNAVILDVGLARSVESNEMVRGTPDYEAPEVCGGEQVADGTTKRDMFSLGLTLVSMFCNGHNPKQFLGTEDDDKEDGTKCFEFELKGKDDFKKEHGCDGGIVDEAFDHLLTVDVNNRHTANQMRDYIQKTIDNYEGFLHDP